MRVERIKASTMHEALSRIKERLGEDAVVLHSRSVNGGIEVIAAQDSDQPATGNTWLDEVIKRDENLRAEGKSNGLKKDIPDQNTGNGPSYVRHGNDKPEKTEIEMPETDNYSKWGNSSGAQEKPKHRDLSHMTIEQLEQATQKATEFSELLKDEIENGQQQHRLWIEHEKQLDNLKREMLELKESLLRQELAELKQRAKNLKNQKDKTKSSTAETKPLSSFQTFYDRVNFRLVEKGIEEATAATIVSRIKLGADSLDLELNNRAHIQILKNILSNEIKKMIPVYHLQNEPGKQIIMTLFGPRHAGKTSTGLKLAMQASIINDKKVALVLLGGFKTDTLQTLNKLTTAAKIPLVAVPEPALLQQTLLSHSDKDIIFIDCAYDACSEVQVNRLNKVMAGIQTIENHLIIPANIKQTDIEQLRSAINKTFYKSIIITKMDKQKKIGRVTGLVHQFGKPVSYICNGQIIPDDIEIANAAKLTHMIFKG